MLKERIYILIVFLCVVQVFSTFTLQKKIKTMEKALSDKVITTEDEISEIYDNIEILLNEQNSLFENCEYKFGDVNTNNLTVDTKFIVSPKEITQDTKLELQIDDKVYNMERQGTDFSVNIPLNIFGKNIEPKIIVSMGEKVFIEKPENILIEKVNEGILPVLNISSFDEKSKFTKDTFTREGRISVDKKVFPSEIDFTDVYLKIESGDNVLVDKKISPENEWDSFTYEINETVSVGENDGCKISLYSYDTLGLLHSYEIENHERPVDGRSKEPTLRGNEKIYNKSGKLVYSYSEI